MADQTLEKRPAYLDTEEAREHNREISENYKRLLDQALPTKEREEEIVYRTTPTPIAEDAIVERPPLVYVDPSAGNAARLADYTAHPAPTKEGKNILFGDVKYRQGGYMAGTRYAEEQAYAPAYAEPAPVQERVNEAVQAPAIERDEAIPTARTMMHRSNVEEMLSEPEVGFWAALTTKTKLLLAAVVTVIVVAVMLVCINTATLGATSASIAEKQLRLDQLVKRAHQLEQQIEKATDPDTIDDWAIENGMYRD